MRNEATVKASATLSYYAGALRAARQEFRRIENSVGDFPADVYAEAMEAAKDELFVAEEEFRCEFQACQVLEELAAGVVPVAPVAVKVPRVRCDHSNEMNNELPELAGLIADVVNVARDETARDYFRAAAMVVSVYHPDTLAKAFRQLNAQGREMVAGHSFDWMLGYVLTGTASGQM